MDVVASGVTSVRRPVCGYERSIRVIQIQVAWHVPVIAVARAALLPLRHGVHLAAEYRIDEAGAGGQTQPVTEWIYFIHPPRDDFAATMTADEKTVWAEHFQRLQRLLASGQLILAGPTLGTVNTGLVVFDAPDEQAARQVMEEDPVVSGGYALGEVRPFRVSLLRGRD
jgi:uncharacterized protein YciI